jgi:hypothetical protein
MDTTSAREFANKVLVETGLQGKGYLELSDIVFALSKYYHNRGISKPIDLADAHAVMDAIDRNGDRRVTKEEFIRYIIENESKGLYQM